MEAPTNHDHEPQTDASDRWSGLKQRVISGLAMLFVVLFALYSGGMLFTTLVFLAALQMYVEWTKLTETESVRWQWAGMAYVTAPCLALLWLRGLHVLPAALSPEEAAKFHEPAGLAIVLFLFAVVWATDIGAYFVGRKIGGPKLAPAISPGKTWAGLAGGVGAAVAMGVLFSSSTAYPSSFGGSIFIAVLLSLVSQAGDLFESWLKRRASVKDSGNLIPGHGGLLDRVDGLTFSAPLFALIVAANAEYLG